MRDLKTVHAVADYLIGTANSLQDAVRFLDLGDADVDELDAALSPYCFCCTQCGWWCSDDEEAECEADGPICTECHEN